MGHRAHTRCREGEAGQRAPVRVGEKVAGRGAHTRKRGEGGGEEGWSLVGTWKAVWGGG